MQGFINTTAGLRPLLLEGIEAVNYSQYSTENQQHGILSIRYVPNSGIGGGNVFVWIPFYSSANYPLERFWSWVGDVSAGAVGKTLNSYYNNKPFVAIQTSSQATGLTTSSSFVYQLADDATVDDACNHAFQSASITGGANTYTNVVTNNGMSSEPTVGSKIYIGTVQGFEETFQEQNTVSSTNPTLPDGTYAYLSSGNPEFMEKGQAAPQTGSIYRVKILQGFVTESVICPVDFTGLGGANDIDGFIPFIYQEGLWDGQSEFSRNNALCYASGQAGTGSGMSTSNNAGLLWIPVKFGFLLFPNSAPQDSSLPPNGEYTCNYTGGQSTPGIPQNAEVFLQDSQSLQYKKMEPGATWEIDIPVDPSLPPFFPSGVQTIAFDDIGAMSGMFGNGTVIMVPPDSFYNPGGNNYSFSIDWGIEYPSSLNPPTNLVCEYFKSGMDASSQFPSALISQYGGGTISQNNNACSGGAAMG